MAILTMISLRQTTTQALVLRICGVFLLLMLSACGQNAPQSDSGMASLQISIPGLNSAARAASRTALRSGVPAEVTSLLIEVLDQKQAVLASAEVVGTDGKVTLVIAAGNNYTVRGTARAGKEVLFKGETLVKKVVAGSRSAVTLSLQDQVSLSINAPVVIQAGAASKPFDFTLNGLNDTRIDWYVNDVKGGSAALGFIDASGLYTPPANVSKDTQINVRAEPVVAPSFAQTFTFTLSPAPAPSNHAPVASNFSLSVNENSSASGKLTASDVDGDSLTYSIVSNGSKGTASITDGATGAFTYTPNANTTGSDSFTFKANDGLADSNVATVMVTVTANVPPFNVTWAVSNYDPNKLNPFNVTVTFPAAVSGFDSSDISLSGAILNGFTTSNSRVFDLTVQPIKTGTVTMDISANSATDALGAVNTAARQLRIPFFNWQFKNPQPTTANLRSITSGGGRCVISGQGGNTAEVLSSSADLQWQRTDIAPAAPASPSGSAAQVLHDIIYTSMGGGQYLAASTGGLYSSRDSKDWTFNRSSAAGGDEDFYAVAEGKDSSNQPLLIAVGGLTGKIIKSSDAKTWTEVDYSSIVLASEFIDLYDVLWDGSQFIAVGSRFQSFSFSNSNKGSIILTSPDGINWTRRYSSSTSSGGFSNTVIDFLNSVTIGKDIAGNKRYVAMGKKGVIVTSPDAVNWTQASTGLGNSIVINSVSWNNNRFVATGLDQVSNSSFHAVIYHSPDGINWTLSTMPAGFSAQQQSFNDVQVCPAQGGSLTNPDIWLIAGQNGVILKSVDGVNWTSVSHRSFSGDVSKFAEGNGLFLADVVTSGPTRDLLQSTDGVNWTSGSNEEFLDLSFQQDMFLGLVRDNANNNWHIKTSTDGVTWVSRLSVPIATGLLPEKVIKFDDPSGSPMWIVAPESDNSIYVSPDKLNWTVHTLTTPLVVTPEISPDGKQLISIINNQLVKSTDALNWTAFGSSFCTSACPFSQFGQVIQIADRYVVFGFNQGFGGRSASASARPMTDAQLYFLYSDDQGMSWSQPRKVFNTICSNGRVSHQGDVLALQCGNLYAGLNGVDWTELQMPFSNPVLNKTASGYKSFGNNVFGDEHALVFDTVPGNFSPLSFSASVAGNAESVIAGSLKAIDADGDALIYSIVSQPASGTVVINDTSTGTFSYTPQSGFSGTDSFSFKVNDGQSDSNIATVTLSVAFVNAVPVASDGSFSMVARRKNLTGILNAFDANADALTYSIASNSLSGTVTITDASTGAFIYKANAGSAGSDSFTFKVNDGQADSNTATVTIIFTPDTDNDGLADAVETGTGVYVNASDTGTDPTVADSDGDGFGDGAEVIYLFSDPTDSASVPLTSNIIRASFDDGAASTFQGSTRPAINADGTAIAYISRELPLNPVDSNGHTPTLFLQKNGALFILNRNSAGNQDAGYSGLAPAIDDQGNRVVFSTGSALSPSDTNLRGDVYLRDVSNSTTTLISSDASGAVVPEGGDQPDISGDGQYVVFRSISSTLVPGDTNNKVDIFVKEIATGKIVRVSVDSSGLESNGHSSNPVISQNGRFIAFTSAASNLVSGDTNNRQDIFRYDRDTDGNGIFDETGKVATIRISLSSAGIEANADSTMSSISDDGNTIAFSSNATNLVSGVTVGGQVYLRDINAGTTRVVSSDGAGVTYGRIIRMTTSALSGDGRYVVFVSNSDQMVIADLSRGNDVFLKDMQTGSLSIMSVSGPGSSARDADLYRTSSDEAVISSNGHYVAFSSFADNLITNDINLSPDIFLAFAHNDSDGDRLSDYAEFIAGSDDHNKDSDGDGVYDGAEIAWGLDPLNASDGPFDLTSDYFNDFESNGNGFTATGLWQLGTPTAGPSAANSGSQLWATNLTGAYAANQTDFLTFPAFKNTGASNPLLTFRYYMDGVNFEDYSYIEVSLNNAKDQLFWAPGKVNLFGNNIYPDCCDINDTLNVWDTQKPLFGTTLFDLSGKQFEGQIVQFRVRMESNGTNAANHTGMYIDDLFIGSNADRDNDGLDFFAEYNAKTDPDKMDTDGDGVNDGAEVAAGTDPNNPASF